MGFQLTCSGISGASSKLSTPIQAQAPGRALWWLDSRCKGAARGPPGDEPAQTTSDLTQEGEEAGGWAGMAQAARSCAPARLTLGP